MRVPKLERMIGIEVYATGSLGVGGVIRESVEDFAVEEMLVDGSKAQINSFEGAGSVLGSSDVRTPHLLCVLFKRDWDTFRAVKAVAQQLGISPQRIHIAGIKDAKALTSQHITVEGVSADEIQRVRIRDMEVRAVGYVRSKISPYFLLGNSFCIAVRKINHSPSVVEKRVSRTIGELESAGGVPNFFGHQRFGTTRPITHLVGKAIVDGDFRKAAMLFLAEPSPHEHPESREVREQLRSTQDFEQALEVFPKRLHYERLMLRHLVKRADDFVGAFRRLPMTLRQLFPQAYQAYLFNRFLSARVKRGLPLGKALLGDYVVSVERSGLPMVNMYRKATVETLGEINDAVEAGRMRLAIPLVGFKLGFSEGVQGEVEKQIAEEEGVSLENFKVKNMVETSSRGELRAVITPLQSFSTDTACNDSVNPPNSMLRLRFTLFRGSYATILLREIMKPQNPIKAGF